MDTALAACAAAVFDTQTKQIIARETLMIEKGHAEVLIPLVERVVAQAGGFETLGRIAVTVGPGSFTGLRVGISAAKGMAIGLNIPVVGVSVLSALAAPELSKRENQTIVSAIDARHGNVYAQIMDPTGKTTFGPTRIGTEELVAMLPEEQVKLVGSGAPMLALAAAGQGRMTHLVQATMAPDILWVARLGALANPEDAPPVPYYLREADAKPHEPKLRVEG
jgi:tRNA threonylcarbamoyladenosine biosynthesis protein TsaB